VSIHELDTQKAKINSLQQGKLLFNIINIYDLGIFQGIVFSVILWFFSISITKA